MGPEDKGIRNKRYRRLKTSIHLQEGLTVFVYKTRGTFHFNPSVLGFCEATPCLVNE